MALTPAERQKRHRERLKRLALRGEEAKNVDACQVARWLSDAVDALNKSAGSRRGYDPARYHGYDEAALDSAAEKLMKIFSERSLVVREKGRGGSLENLTTEECDAVEQIHAILWHYRRLRRSGNSVT